MFSYQDGGRGYTGSSKTDSHLWIVMFTQAGILLSQKVLQLIIVNSVIISVIVILVKS